MFRRVVQILGLLGLVVCSSTTSAKDRLEWKWKNVFLLSNQSDKPIKIEIKPYRQMFECLGFFPESDTTSDGSPYALYYLEGEGKADGEWQEAMVVFTVTPELPSLVLEETEAKDYLRPTWPWSYAYMVNLRLASPNSVMCELNSYRDLYLNRDIEISTDTQANGTPFGWHWLSNDSVVLFLTERKFSDSILREFGPHWSWNYAFQIAAPIESSEPVSRDKDLILKNGWIERGIYPLVKGASDGSCVGFYTFGSDSLIVFSSSHTLSAAELELARKQCCFR